MKVGRRGEERGVVCVGIGTMQGKGAAIEEYAQGKAGAQWNWGRSVWSSCFVGFWLSTTSQPITDESGNMLATVSW